MIPTELEELHSSYWDAHHTQYDMATNEGCGKYTEAFVKYGRAQGYIKLGHLKKNPGQTQYNGHANDAVLYNDGTGNPNGLLQAIDIIARAEQPHPWKGEVPNDPHTGNDPPEKNWGIDIPRYKESDWFAEPSNGGNPVPVNTVPWVGYPGDASNAELKRILSFDYSRKPQGADFDVSVWAFRVMYTNLMGLVPPSQGGKPLGMTASVEHHRPEWCGALGVPIIPVPSNWVG